MRLFGWTFPEAPARPEWHFFHNYRTRTLIDGRTSRGYLLMRRKVNGVAEYREPTQEEFEESISLWAI